MVNDRQSKELDAETMNSNESKLYYRLAISEWSDTSSGNFKVNVQVSKARGGLHLGYMTFVINAI